MKTDLASLAKLVSAMPVVVAKHAPEVDQATLALRIADLAPDGFASRTVDASSTRVVSPEGDVPTLTVVHGFDPTNHAVTTPLRHLMDEIHEGSFHRLVVMVDATKDADESMLDRAAWADVDPTPALTAPLVHMMREASGIGMATCKDAAVEALRSLDGDFALAICVADANGLAVKIGSRDPAVDDKEARRRWNLAEGLAKRHSVAAWTPAWRRLVAVSGTYRGG